ncbi:PEGA domain-containing protein [Deinococcus multiflagellatus]|uniref:PEGA domain-containing protein n=1 Tax=Deinococcus multiflagellatus TaxID=1656887 RepID=A0ABW1ZP57_9DEIO|nr:PEGA domain-containing protein [Deinococcus multiflagellatus]MBZ9714883.1 PEGA domain-containing protein [Deinococcus multiflagellatus]
MDQVKAQGVAPSHYLPTPNTHDSCLSDLTALWYLAVSQGKEREAQARAVFAQHPGAKTDLKAAQAAQHGLRTLLGLATTPQEEHVPTAGVPFEASGSMAEGHEAEDAVVPLSEDPTPLPSADAELPLEGSIESVDESGDAVKAAHDRLIAWPGGTLGEGLISMLSAPLAVGETVQLVIARTSAGQIVASIVPQHLDGQPADLRKDLSGRGTPQELDLEFLAARPHHQATRQTVQELAAALLATTQAVASKAAQASKKKAEEAKATQQAVQQATLIVTPNVEGASIVVKGEGGPWTPGAGKSCKLGAGKYTVRVEAVGHDPTEEDVVLRPKETKTIKVTLKARPQGLF